MHIIHQILQPDRILRECLIPMAIASKRHETGCGLHNLIGGVKYMSRSDPGCMISSRCGGPGIDLRP